ncbi:MAG: alkyl sulfatase BDS1-like metallo-beta-lactamase superfamily hydrolase, partial [Myxococcota bacterium]
AMLTLLLAQSILLGCAHPPPPPLPIPTPLSDHCTEAIGSPRIEEVSPGVFLAIGWDLANTILVQTAAGRVVIDAGMSPARASAVRAALDGVSHGPILAVIYTHSHIDHVGGASVWVEADTEVWATDAFTEHFFSQYSVLLPSQTDRGAHQFGIDVPDADLPCSALGRRVDLEAALENGARLPTHTFSGAHTLTFGEHTLQLVEAHGETHDQLFVWMPDTSILMAGDNWYRAFPNLYTLRGTRPRPVDDWIGSLDAMRRLDPELLLPSHTTPIHGRESVRTELRDYRDGIQWVRDSVVRSANAGADLDGVVRAAALPAHLAAVPALAERYGQVDWSARAIYTNELGWFDEHPEALYPLPPDDEARRMIAMMGGEEAVLTAATSADDPRWSLRLFALLRAVGQPHPEPTAAALTALARQTENTNGRAWLLQSAAELRGDAEGLTGEPTISNDFLQQMPIEAIFESMGARLFTEQTLDIHTTIRFELSDLPAPWSLTIRRGILEVVEGDPLPGTPEPVAVLITDSLTWKQLALGTLSPLAAVTSGVLQIEGDRGALIRFLDHFDQDLTRK